MFVFASVAITVLLAALAAAHALCPPERRWTLVRAIAAFAVFAGGLVTAIVARLRFASVEANNEWARDAFAQFSKPLTFTVIAAVFILAASALTAKGKAKRVICLAAAAAFSLLVFGYTALFFVMTEGGALSVDGYIRLFGCALCACFGAVDLAAEIKLFVRPGR